MSKTDRYRWAFLVTVLIFLPLLVRSARADGGVVLCQRTAAPFNITVFFTEMPLRPGPADLSVLLEETEGHSPILDAQVFIELEHEEGMIIRAEATRKQARNKLLYCSLINFPASGRWKMKLHVTQGNHRAEMLSDVLVVAPQPVLLSYWQLFAVPPVIIVLFIFNQGLRRRTTSRVATAKSLRQNSRHPAAPGALLQESAQPAIENSPPILSVGSEPFMNQSP